MTALMAGCHLEERGIMANVVSVPCFELFCEQPQAYIDAVVAPGTKVLAVEAASGLEWYRFADDVLRMESFGASGKANELFKHFGFTIADVVARAEALVG
jgi:transketolase